ncbi:phage tail length tape measure family protein [Ancylobacter sp. FA202]|uniref:phage tail length tape measure family protein n=1 Tax=Ancylobacter sp. FA202 TaxID=1111106 RepID=UPI001FDA20F3|nr:phage tail length tape measure family protein [Ancylobacter sp. FA202]
MTRRLQQETKATAEAAAVQQRYNALLGVRDDFGTDARAADIAAFAQEYDRYIAKLVAAKDAEQELARARAATAQSAINQNLGVRDDFGSAGRAADIAAVGEEIQRLRERYVPLAAVQRRYLETLQEINAAAKLGVLSEAQRADAVARTKTAFAEQVVAIRGVQEAGGRLRLASHDLTNLGYQVNDMLTMLASGAPPLQILATQAGQVYQVLANQQGGLTGGVKALGGSLAGLVTPVGIAVTALTAVGVTAAAAYGTWITAEKELQAALQGRGRATGATAQELMAIAAAASQASGVTQGAARDIAASLTSTGQIATGFYVDLIAAAEAYASITTGDVRQAGQELAEAFAEPGKGAEALNKKLNFLDDTTLQYVKSLDAANRTTEAQALLLDRLNATLPNAEQRLTALGRAWKTLSGSISDAFANVGRTINDSLELSVSQRGLAQLQESLNQLPDAGFLTDWKRKQILADIAVVEDAMEQQRRWSAQGNNEAQRNKISTAGGDALRGWDGRYDELSRLRTQQADLQRALQAGVGDADAQQRALEGVTNQIGQMTDAYGALIPQAEIVRREQELQNALLTAVTPAQRAAASAALARYRAETEGADGSTAAAKANAAAQQEMLQASVQLTLAGRQRLLSAQEGIAAQGLEIELIGKTAGEVATLRANYAAYWDLKREAIDNGTEVDQRQLELLKAQNAELGRKVELTARAQLMADIQFERDQLGRGPVDQQIAATLRSSGLAVDLDSADAAALRLNATLSTTRDIAGQALSGFARDILDGADAMTALENAAKRALDVILDMAMQNLAASLFGPGTGGSNFLGSIVSAFTGGAGAGVGSHAGGGGLGPLYDKGGYTGSGGKYQPAGTVHRGEYVFSSEATRAAGVGSLDALHRGLRGYADGGGVGMMDALRHATGQSAKGSGGSGGGITVNVHVRNEAPGVAVSAGAATQRGDDSFDIEMIVEQIEGKLATNVSQRRGSLSAAFEGSYGLNPMKGRSR